MATTADRDCFTHFVDLTVRWGEMDALGHVNNVVYFRYSEVGRVAYLRGLTGGRMLTDQAGPILADQRCRFVQQLIYPAEIQIASRIRAIGRSSLAMEQALFRQGETGVLAGFEGVVVWFDYNAQASTPVPESVRAAIRAYEKIAPEE